MSSKRRHRPCPHGRPDELAEGAREQGLDRCAWPAIAPVTVRCTRPVSTVLVGILDDGELSVVMGAACDPHAQVVANWFEEHTLDDLGRTRFPADELEQFMADVHNGTSSLCAHADTQILQADR